MFRYVDIDVSDFNFGNTFLNISEYFRFMRNTDIEYFLPVLYTRYGYFLAGDFDRPVIKDGFADVDHEFRWSESVINAFLWIVERNDLRVASLIVKPDCRFAGPSVFFNQLEFRSLDFDGSLTRFISFSPGFKSGKIELANFNLCTSYR